MKQGSHVVISRKWNNPEISINVRHDRIDIGMSLTDFVTAMVKEVGNPTRLVTAAQLQRKLFQAADAITVSMKNETVPFA